MKKKLLAACVVSLCHPVTHSSSNPEQFSGHPLLNVNKVPKCNGEFLGSENRFNQEPQNSTFTRKINRATKRW